MAPREAGGPDTEPLPVCATGPSGQGKGNLRLLPHQPGAQSKGMNGVGASPGLPPGPRRRTAGLQQPGPRVRVRLQRGPWVPGIWGDVQLMPIRGCVHTCPGGSGHTCHSRPGVGLRSVSAAGSRCRCSRLTRGSRVTRTPPASPHSAACPCPAVSAPHSYPVPRRCQRPTRRCCSCPAPPPPTRPCTRGDAGEAPTAGRHTLSVAVILKPTPARRPPPPRPPDSAGPTGPLFHWELPISARDGSVLTIQRPQSEVLGFHSHAPDGRCCTPCPVWLTLHPRYLARCLGLAKY